MVLNQARCLLEQYQYALEWNAEIHRADDKVEAYLLTYLFTYLLTYLLTY